MRRKVHALRGLLRLVICNAELRYTEEGATWDYDSVTCKNCLRLLLYKPKR